MINSSETISPPQTTVLVIDHVLLLDVDEASPLDIDEDPRGDIVSGLHLLPSYSGPRGWPRTTDHLPLNLRGPMATQLRPTTQ